ncbi:MAG TPA: glutamate--tRNA ligase [Candidatus Deferrimicrobium sp.]|nr:glutamate--tRNA ligase [Candidatus Deferrimicrobium sp.]
MREIRTRFAPSPTGYMHIGNLRTAIYEYLVAKSQNGKFILRIEDTDQERYVEGAIEVIYNTMHSVGLHYDEGPDVGGDYGPYTQSERKGIYKEYAHRLVEQGGAYFCFCSKDRLDNLRKECESRKEAFRYDGHCQQLSKEEIDQRLNNNEPYVVRQKVPQGGTTSFTDLVYGTITVENSQLDEGVLLKADGMPTYNFANVIDDHLMQITHVVRGSEYLSSTPKYNLVYQAFGWEIPDYIHLPPIMKTAEKKLSKREGDASFEDFVNKGYLKEAIVNYIVLLGWNPGTNEEFFTLDELIQIFSLQGLSKSPAIFDPNKLRWMNGEYIRRMSLEKFHALATPYYTELNGSSVDQMKLSKLLQQRTEVLSEIPEKIDFLAQLPDYNVEMYINKKMKTNLSDSLEHLKEVKEVLAGVNNWEFADIHDSLFELVNTLGVKNGQILWPLRTAVSGKDVSPGGGVELAELMGKQETLRRIEIGIDKLAQIS